MDAEPAEMRTLSRQVTRTLERKIFEGELRPGTRLPTEAELCEAFSVSRSVIRDSIQSLRAKGLVLVRQGHGTVVAEPSEAPLTEALLTALIRSRLLVGDVIDARAAIETEFSRLAARRGSAEDWALMDESLAAFFEAVAASDWHAAHLHHVEFHLGLLRAIHMPALDILLKPMQEIIMVSSLPPQIDDYPALWELDAHPLILEALRRGDEDEVHAAVGAHFAYMRTDAYADLRATTFADLVGIERYRQFLKLD